MFFLLSHILSIGIVKNNNFSSPLAWTEAYIWRIPALVDEISAN